MRVAISGANGLIGAALVRAVEADGGTVVRIGRGANADVQWRDSFDTIDARALDGLDAVVHLAGAPIAQRWTATRKREILRTRVESTALLARAVTSLSRPPRVFVCASAVGYYGDRSDETLTEESSAGSGFLADVVRAWEDATRPIADAGIRVVNTRTGIVLARGGGALAKMLFPFQLGVGGPIGSGRQWMSWIALDDVTRAIRFLIGANVAGPVNVVGPDPATNTAFARALGAALHRPTLLRVPAFALRALFGEMASDTVLASQRAMPARLTRAGFTFAEPSLDGALRRALASSR